MGLISIYSLSALGATMLGLIVTPLVMRQSRILGLLDMPGARKVRLPLPLMCSVTSCFRSQAPPGLSSPFCPRPRAC
jgi:hypothetical protein